MTWKQYFLHMFTWGLIAIALWWYAPRIGLFDVALFMPTWHIGFDKVIHVLGGISAAFGGLFWYALQNPREHGPRVIPLNEDRTLHRINTKIIVVTLLSAAVAGGVWEIMESHCPPFAPPEGMTQIDTIGDLIADICGGFIVSYFTTHKRQDGSLY